MYRYQATHSFHVRLKETTAVRSRYPDHVPIICEPAQGHESSQCDDALFSSARRRVQRELDRSKFLLPEKSTMTQLMILLRRRLLLEEGQGVFVFVGGELPPNSSCVGDLYRKWRDPDGFLYMSYGIENTFGGVAGSCERGYP
ncbi:putative microtubule-associated protein 1A [Trypanosoma vivax]|nr:putative microtubule-associated protein 1A [Trypanosoma vivax]